MSVRFFLLSLLFSVPSFSCERCNTERTDLEGRMKNRLETSGRPAPQGQAAPSAPVPASSPSALDPNFFPSMKFSASVPDTSPRSRPLAR
jgi:hypothetical protein